MTEIPIYTVGYGNRTIADFLELLDNYKILYLLDIRTNPNSAYDKSYVRGNLLKSLKQKNITYVFMGDLLGGLPPEEECYTEGKVDYQKVKIQPFYLRGIKRIETAYQKKIPIVLMCSELRPESCHRSKLIGQTLSDRKLEVKHIDETGQLTTQEEIIERITGGQLNLFGDDFTSRKRYK